MSQLTQEGIMTHLQEELFKLQDIAYRDFHSSLMPGVDKEAVIGVRIPVLRKFAKGMQRAEKLSSLCVSCHISIMRRIIFI